MTVFRRKRVAVVAAVAAFVAALAALGALSRATTTVPAPAVAVQPATGSTVPFASWYWTMAVSPADPNVLVLGTSSGLDRSSDGGKTWKPTGPAGINATSLVTIGNVIFMGGARGESKAGPVIRTGAVRSVADGAAVVEASTDGGQTWRVLHPSGLPNIAVQALASDPANSTALYALLNNGKLYRSTDDASSFQIVSSKLGIPPWAFAITQGNHFVGGDMDIGPHVSTNGLTWQQTAYTDARGGHMVMEYAVQPTDTTRVLMTSIGIETSTDSGTTWHTALKSTVMYGPVAWAPSKPDLAYAVGFDGSVWHSADSGTSWTKVR